jgi:Flp pilus assembly protein TadG
MSRSNRQRQQGTVLVELALTLPVLLALLAAIVFYGRVLYNYDVVQKASRDAVRYLSSAAASNMQSATRAGYETAVATAIAAQELADLNPGEDNGPFIYTACDGYPCTGPNLPTMVLVNVKVTVHNGTLGDYAPYMPDITLEANNTMRYVGN